MSGYRGNDKEMLEQHFVDLLQKGVPESGGLPLTSVEDRGAPGAAYGFEKVEGFDRYCLECNFAIRDDRDGVVHEGCLPCHLCHRAPKVKLDLRIPFDVKQGWEEAKRQRIMELAKLNGVRPTKKDLEVIEPDAIDMKWVPWACECLKPVLGSVPKFLSLKTSSLMLKKTFQYAIYNRNLSEWETVDFLKALDYSPDAISGFIEDEYRRYEGNVAPSYVVALAFDIAFEPIESLTSRMKKMWIERK